MSSLPPDSGREEANDFAAFYRQHHRALCTLSNRLLRDAALAEDIAQETLIRAWTKRAGFQSDDELAAWVRRVARNLCIDNLRRRGKLVPVEKVPDRAGGDDISSGIEAQERRRFLRTALSQMNTRHREMLYLHDVEGVEYDTLAQEIGLSYGATRQLVFRARRGLRHILEAAGTGMLGIVAPLRLRLRGSEDHLGAATPSLPALSATVAQVVLAITFVTGGGISGSSLAPAELAPAPVASFQQAVVFPTPASPAPDNTSTLGSRNTRAPLGPDVQVGTHVPLPGSDDTYVWVHVWQDNKETPAPVASTMDEASSTTCDAATEQCETVNGVVQTPPPTPAVTPHSPVIPTGRKD